MPYVEAQLAAVRGGERREFLMHLRRPDGAVREAAVVAVPAAGEEAGRRSCWPSRAT